MPRALPLGGPVTTLTGARRAHRQHLRCAPLLTCHPPRSVVLLTVVHEQSVRLGCPVEREPDERPRHAWVDDGEPAAPAASDEVLGAEERDAADPEREPTILVDEMDVRAAPVPELERASRLEPYGLKEAEPVEDDRPYAELTNAQLMARLRILRGEKDKPDKHAA